MSNLFEFNQYEVELILEALDYLLGAGLEEENGWTSTDIATLNLISLKLKGGAE